jgi:hypothetical protein
LALCAPSVGLSWAFSGGSLYTVV